MAKRAEDYIPRDIQDAAEAGGLSSTPQWYVGRSNHEKRVSHGLGIVVWKAREKAGLGPPKLIDPAEHGGQG